MKQLILDTNLKEIRLALSSASDDPLHITTHWFDYYKISEIRDLGNWYGISNGTTPVTIVASPTPVNCWKREITSISVYNPNDEVVTFYVMERDANGDVYTIIDEVMLNPHGSRTLECICDSCNSCGGINIYGDSTLIYGNALNLNFLPCLTTEYNIITGHVDIGIDLGVSFDDQTNVLSICGDTIDLSSLAGASNIDVYNDGNLVSSTPALNFTSCLEATWDAINDRINVAFNPSMSFDCNTKLLTVCGEDVDLWCEKYQYGYQNMGTATASTAVMNNGIIILDNTENIELPIIPLSPTNLRINGSIFYIWNKGPVVSNVLAAAGVTIANNPGTIAVDETIGFIIRNIGPTTKYLRIS